MRVDPIRAEALLDMVSDLGHNNALRVGVEDLVHDLMWLQVLASDRVLNRVSAYGAGRINSVSPPPTHPYPGIPS